MCICINGYIGNPFSQCELKQQDYPVEIATPCSPSPCGSNAICREQNGAGACTCIDEYIGNPYEGCRPECVLNSDCPSNLACIRNKCQDPCPGTCGQNAQCQVVNHLPSCTCFSGYTGDPFRYCNIIQAERKNPFQNSFIITNKNHLQNHTHIHLFKKLLYILLFIIYNSYHFIIFSGCTSICQSLSTITLWSKQSMP
jgi:hypothetical protein